MSDQLIEENYKIHAAGLLWNVSKITFKKGRTGGLVIPKSEIDRVNRAIANYLCTSDNPLSWEEFDFLCSVSITKYKEISDELNISKSTVSKWKSSKIDYPTSLILKQFFWGKIFITMMNNKAEIEIQSNTKRYLSQLGYLAISNKWTEEIEPAVA